MISTVPSSQFSKISISSEYKIFLVPSSQRETKYPCCSNLSARSVLHPKSISRVCGRNPCKTIAPPATTQYSFSGKESSLRRWIKDCLSNMFINLLPLHDCLRSDHKAIMILIPDCYFPASSIAHSRMDAQGQKKIDKPLDEVCRFCWSEWRDLNPRPHGPEPCALPTALHPDGYIIIVASGGVVKMEPRRMARFF